MLLIKGINRYKDLLKSFDKWWIIYKAKKLEDPCKKKGFTSQKPKDTSQQQKTFLEIGRPWQFLKVKFHFTTFHLNTIVKF
jgi:hypothetical protein